MFDFHTHTLISDGELIPAEHVRRAEVAGYKILGISDHADLATLPAEMPAIVATARAENKNPDGLLVVPGAEITHVRPGQIAEAVKLARELGAACVIVHGETIVEPVMAGTNRAAIEAGVDILAHPGLIRPDDVRLAAERGVKLEITGRRGHSLTNGHVVKLAREYGAELIVGSDAHTVGDMMSRDFAEQVCLGAGLSQSEIDAIFERAERFGKKLAAALPG